MTEPPHMPEGSNFPPAPQAHPESILTLATKLGEHGAHIVDLRASRDKLGERMGAVEVGQARIEAGQAHAAAMSNAQHAEVLNKLAKVDALAEHIPAFLARLDSITARTERVDEVEDDRRKRGFFIMLPNLTTRQWLSMVVLAATVVAVFRAGWPELFAAVGTS